VETSLTALGAPAGRNFDVSIVAALFEWNDPAGVLLFQRGWAIHDRQSALFGELSRPLVRDPSIPNIESFDEVDGRAGYYAGVEAKLSGKSTERLAPLHVLTTARCCGNAPARPVCVVCACMVGT
jgi:hypothetical protein